MIAVATLNSKIYSCLVGALKGRDVNFIFKSPYETIPLSVRVVITTKDEAKYIKHHTILTCNEKNIEKTVDEAVNIVKGLSGKIFDEIVVGIDPGKTIGFAVVGEGIVLEASTYTSFKEVFQALIRICQTLNPKKILVKVGLGGCFDENFKIWMEKIKEKLLKKFGVEVKILFVDEKNTTTVAKKRRIKRKERDKVSAVEIALRK